MSEQFDAGAASGVANISSAAPKASRAPLVWLLLHFALGCLGAVTARIFANRARSGWAIETLFPSLWDQVMTMGPWFAACSVFLLVSHVTVHRYFRHLTKYQRDVIWIPCIVAAIAGLTLTFSVIWMNGRA